MQVSRKTLIMIIGALAVAIALGAVLYYKKTPVSTDSTADKALTQQAATDAENNAQSAATAAQSARKAAESTRKTADSASTASTDAIKSAHDAAKSSFDQNQTNDEHKK
jgi:hypothetical protein